MNYKTDTSLDLIVGLTVENIYYNDDTIYIKVQENIGETEKKVFALNVYGDCCSNSFWTDIIHPGAIIGRKIERLSSVRQPESQWKGGPQECDDSYGLDLDSGSFYTRLIFVNSSNGYYGGWMECSLTNEVHGNPILSDWHLK